MDSLSRFAHGILVAVSFLIPVTAFAIDPPPVTPSGIGNFLVSSGQLLTRVDYQIGTGSSSTFLEKTVAIAPETIGAAARAVLGLGTVAVVLTAVQSLLDEAQYTYNSSNGTITTAGKAATVCTTSPYYQTVNYHAITSCSVADMHVLYEQWADPYIANLYCGALPDPFVVPDPGDPPNQANFSITVTSNCNGNSYTPITETIKAYALDPNNPPTQPAESGTTVTDAQLGNYLLTHADPTFWQLLLTDQTTGMPITTPEIQAEQWQIQKDQVQAQGGDPTTVPQPTDTGSVTTASSEPAPETKWPSFCTWASVVCDFIDWVKSPGSEPTPPQLPVLDVPQPSGWDSGLGSGGTCPPDTVINIWSGASITIPWGPACQAADIMRPVLLAMAYLIAAGILIGRKGGAT